MAMRQSNIYLTTNVYTDPTLLDVAGAVEALPGLNPRCPLQHHPRRATGTGDVATVLNE